MNLQTDYKVAYSFIGGPRASSVESLAKATAAAKKMANSQKSRHPSSLSKRKTVELLVDPDMRESDEEVEGLELWKLLPQLKDIPEHLLKKMPLSAVFMLNNALAKEQKTSERLGVNTMLRSWPRALFWWRRALTTGEIFYIRLASWGEPVVL